VRDAGEGWARFVFANRPDKNTNGSMTVVWRIDQGFDVMLGWTRSGEKAGFTFYPNWGRRCRGEVGLSDDLAPVPIFGAGLSRQTFETGLEQLVNPKLGRLFEMTYDPAAGTIHGRYPNSRNATLRTSCLLFRDIPVDEESLVPMVIFREGIFKVTIVSTDVD
jgi:hypothetical protein